VQPTERTFATHYYDTDAKTHKWTAPDRVALQLNQHQLGKERGVSRDGQGLLWTGCGGGGETCAEKQMNHAFEFSVSDPLSKYHITKTIEPRFPPAAIEMTYRNFRFRRQKLYAWRGNYGGRIVGNYNLEERPHLYPLLSALTKQHRDLFLDVSMGKPNRREGKILLIK
jgi:hypothetical protein